MDMENYENKAVESLGDWYQLFKDGGVTDEQKVSPTNVVGELLIDAIKLREYTNFISQFANSIEQDIRADVVADIVQPVVQNAVAPVPPIAVAQPLRMAADNRELAVKYTAEISTLVNAIDGILSRVKFKEQ